MRIANIVVFSAALGAFLGIEGYRGEPRGTVTGWLIAGIIASGILLIASIADGQDLRK